MKKYQEHREFIQTGDIILYHGNSLVAKGIQYFDSAYYNHVGVAWNVADRKLTIDAWSNGVEIVPLSRRMDAYKDFCIIRPKDTSSELIQAGINEIVNMVEENASYDYAFLLRKLILLKFGYNIEKLNNPSKVVCSELVAIFAFRIGLTCYNGNGLITPQDFLRHGNKNEVETILNDSLK